MSKISKIVSILLVVVMVIGVSLTALADESAKAKTDEQKAQEVAAEVDTNVSSADPDVSVSIFTDTASLALGYDMDIEADGVIASLADQFTEPPTVVGTLYFDVSGQGGDVTIQASPEYANKLGVASHFNTATGQIEQMSSLVEFDSQGRGTVSFSSYSPVMIKILNVTRDSLKSDSTVGVKTVNVAARQAEATPSGVKTAKMGE